MITSVPPASAGAVVVGGGTVGGWCAYFLRRAGAGGGGGVGEGILGRGARESATRTIAPAGRAVVTSGLTVIVGFAALLIIPVPETRSIAIGGLMVVAVAVALALSLPLDVPDRQVLQEPVFGITLVTILVQGPLAPLITRRAIAPEPEKDA